MAAMWTDGGRISLYKHGSAQLSRVLPELHISPSQAGYSSGESQDASHEWRKDLIPRSMWTRKASAAFWGLERSVTAIV